MAVATTTSSDMREVQDLERAHAVLFDLVERQDIPVFDDLHTAVHCAAKVLRMGISVKDLTKTDGAQPVQNAHICVVYGFTTCACEYRRRACPVRTIRKMHA
ncbi:hypothetical protein Bbelb_433830 [Branchiostoma belcheri]|nr:hypothetical protein Bbelb_433830 [Branchiostoma belcheri]